MTPQDRSRELIASIVYWLNGRGHYVWRQNSGKAHVGRRWIHLGPSGTPDVIGFTNTGIFLGVEVKADPKDVSNEDQQRVAGEITSRDGIHYVARHFDLFTRWAEQRGL